MKERGLNIISPKDFDKEIVEDILEEPPKEVRKVLKEFPDIVPSELPDALPHMHDIQHAIDFVPNATLPNLPHYRLNSSEHVELQRQVYE